MNLILSPRAEKQLAKLPPAIRKKAQKQFSFLLKDYRHPSLRTRKMATGNFEGRVDYHYRFTFSFEHETIFILTVGPHDEGLGKK